MFAVLVLTYHDYGCSSDRCCIVSVDILFQILSARHCSLILHSDAVAWCVELGLAFDLAGFGVGFDVLDGFEVGVEAEGDGEGRELHGEVPEVDEVLLRNRIRVTQPVKAVV